jgi:ribosomal peptide maturation radical SAM protein 1
MVATDEGGRDVVATVLVSMPFMQIDRPSIQLGLLKAIGDAHGFPVRTLHANLDFAARIGTELYVPLADHCRHLVGEWLFSVEAFGDAAPDRDARLLVEFGEEFASLAGSASQARERLLRVRDHDVPAYLDALVEGFPWHEAEVVGFSSTFQQSVASFALARRLKERFPGIVTVFGGANFDGEMGVELARSVGCVDYTVIGEADSAFPALLKAIAAGTDPTAVPGVTGGAGATAPAPPTEALDDLPAPDYTEYFERAESLALPVDDAWIPFESARGCWWGAKHHCVFCGLNGSTMRFRAKSPARVLEEISAQARRHRNFRFEAVDNILDPSYLKDLFPALADRDFQFFYEVKANLSREQLKTLAHAGVTQLQPGLESLSSHVLRLMDKGVRAAQNVNLLRWARYYGIGVGWNILWGFPGETEDDYLEQAAAVPNLVHLQPPQSANRLWLERFSPMYSQPERFPLRRRAPEASYRFVYPSTVDLERVAYFFDHEFAGALPASAYAPLRKAVDAWSQAWRDSTPPVLVYRSTPGFLRILDTRHEGRKGVYTFHDTLADIYLACVERPTTAAAVHGKLALSMPVSAVADALRRFAERGLMFLDGNLAVSLALPATPGR